MQTLHNHKQTAFWNMKVILICTYENMFETLLFQAYLQKSHLAKCDVTNAVVKQFKGV